MSLLARFAGYASPQAMLADPSLSRDDKLSGLLTWRGLIVRLGVTDDERERLLREIDRALALLAPRRCS